MNDSYWTLDTSLFEGRFRYFGTELALVRGKVHTENEDYWPSDINQEITPIAITRGVRTYVHCKPFVLTPDIVVTIGLYKQPSETGAIGEVIASQEAPKMKEGFQRPGRWLRLRMTQCLRLSSTRRSCIAWAMSRWRKRRLGSSSDDLPAIVTTWSPAAYRKEASFVVNSRHSELSEHSERDEEVKP